MICDACKRQLGANPSRHAHANLSSPGQCVPPEFQVQRYQNLYACKVCRSILSRGRNTGWTQAGSTLPSANVASAPASVIGF